MSKIQNPTGTPTPEKSSAITWRAEIEKLPPHSVKSPSKARKRKPASGSTPDLIDDLAKIFEDYQSSGSETDRDRFYQSLWKVAEKRARYQLACMDWKGDIREDAMDVTSVFCQRLLRQERKLTGLFKPAPRRPSQLRGYLNRTIYGGVKEQAQKYRTSRRPWLCCNEDAVLSAVDTRNSDWLPQVIRLTKALDAARAGKKKLVPDAPGTTSLDLVLQLALDSKVPGGEVKYLARQEGVPFSTQQNWARHLRSDLRHELEI